MGFVANFIRFPAVQKLLTVYRLEHYCDTVYVCLRTKWPIICKWAARLRSSM